MNRIWDLYPALARAVKRTHDEATDWLGGPMFHCHDFDHALRVANYAMMIAPDEKTGRLAAIAGLCHNADRILQKKLKVGPFGKVPKEAIEAMVRDWLSVLNIQEMERGDSYHPPFATTEDGQLVMDAVLNHGNKNGKDDSLVLITIMDADRLVNIEADVLVRDGQYFGDAMRVVDPVHIDRDPNANFRNLGSILRNSVEKFDWETEGGFVGIRLPKARELMKSRFAFLRLWIKTIREQREEAELFPYPSFD
ncbi:MAG: hypothetical protein A2648_00990 [Candidatus Lloydbacteria bacterium RIFCSPHIGHO2_01_FULL_41_20]|uniref:HD/PDEase domain-containing protein n=1 Tax=Candidatus Lloydbacteria bacterium RIFCSPHIGHO2_01_FULL_41_20 TaxID=1798657 RepID=A0A1G2CTS2_9BACT|nr:MAG: hypothetical protein A2648_00990 [Candidatus Lloydbacteria bacterium RIFCSPHIGHO2_01_FULL_41_20]